MTEIEHGQCVNSAFARTYRLNEYTAVLALGYRAGVDNVTSSMPGSGRCIDAFKRGGQRIHDIDRLKLELIYRLWTKKITKHSLLFKVCLYKLFDREGAASNAFFKKFGASL